MWSWTVIVCCSSWVSNTKVTIFLCPSFGKIYRWQILVFPPVPENVCSYLYQPPFRAIVNLLLLECSWDRNCQLWSDLELTDSTSQSTVDKCSSVNNLSRIITFWERFPDSTRDSHILPKQGLIGAVNFKFIFFATRCLLAEFWSILFMACFNSFEAPTKFVSFLDLMFTLPLFEMNLWGKYEHISREITSYF